MKIRTQLIAAFLLLAVAPLTAIVAWTAWSSLHAVRRAVEAEAAELTRQMEERTAEIKDDLRTRVERLGRLPWTLLYPESGGEGAAATSSPGSRQQWERVLDDIGDAAPLVDSLVFVPRPPAAPAPPETLAPSEVPAPSEPKPPTPPTAERKLQAMRIDLSRLRRQLEAAGQLENVEDLDVIEDLEQNEQTRAMIEKAVDFGLKMAEIATKEAAAQLDAEAHKQIDSRAELLEWQEKLREQKEMLGRDFDVEVREQGRLVGAVHTQVNAKELLHRVLGSTPRDRGALPFALDEKGQLYAADADRPALEALGLELDSESGLARASSDPGEWVIVSLDDADSGLVFGVARPIGASLAAIRRTSWVNLGAGMILIGLALLGVLPLSARISRGIEAVTRGADRIAGGDLTTRVPVEGGGEVARLALTFNHMAAELSEHQEKLLAKERQQRQQEIEKRLLEERFAHKSSELEDARQFQLALLPKSLPRHPAYELAVDMRTAAEVGGDYYDLHLSESGTLTVAVGDATGHGARAGTMVTVIKTLFSSAGAELPPEVFLERASATIRGLRLERMLMGLTLARIEDGSVLLSAAGMPPVLAHRGASGEVDEYPVSGMPLGALECVYESRRTELEAGDSLLFVSDGLPELLGDSGEPFGYERLRQRFAAAAWGGPKNVISELEKAASEWTGGQALQDDMTFVVVRRVAT